MRGLMSLSSTAALIAAVASTLLGTPAAAAGNDGGSSCTGYSASNSWYVQCQTAGQAPGGGGGGARPVCYWSSKVGQYWPNASKYLPPPGKGNIYLVRVCGNIYGLPQLVSNGGALTPGALAQRAYAELAPPQPDPATAPPRGDDGLVGLPEWFWVPAAQWQPLRRCAAEPMWAEVTATPSRLTFSPGTGLREVSCAGPGTAYDPSKPASAQQSDCAYTYTWPSNGLPGNAYTARVTITCTATWRGSGGAGGTFPPLTRTISFALPVANSNAVVRGGSG
jgi:hypothetical protein